MRRIVSFAATESQMKSRRLPILLALGLLPALSFAQAMPADLTGARDHPLLGRYAGSWLVAAEQKEFDATAVPTGPKDGQALQVEGRIVRLFYLSPAGRSVLEVQRNYEQALEKAGATRRDACAMPDCGTRDLRFFGDARGKQLAAATIDGWDTKTLVDQWVNGDSARWWYGTLNAQGAVLHVAVLSAKPGVIQLADKHVATVVQIVQPQSMESGKVTVDAGAIARGLQADGKMALYGVYFDTGKSELKPESKAQLAEMAKLLQGNAALRVFVVGHTDNQGSVEANLALSRARAQAVVDALVKSHKIDAKRLGAAGVAGYAPVASNAAETGRAKNRRVELVVQ
jgi:outer membrane protein OmpA-like peptidoglycan-associated protein